MADVQTQRSVEELEAELTGIDAQVEEAAVAEDGHEFLRLLMRQKALPMLIRRAQAQLVRREIAELEEELGKLDEEMQRIQEGPPEAVPAGLRGQITPAMVRARKVSGVSSRSLVASKELSARRKELSELEAEGPAAGPEPLV